MVSNNPHIASASYKFSFDLVADGQLGYITPRQLQDVPSPLQSAIESCKCDGGFTSGGGGDGVYCDDGSSSLCPGTCIYLPLREHGTTALRRLGLLNQISPVGNGRACSTHPIPTTKPMLAGLVVVPSKIAEARCVDTCSIGDRVRRPASPISC